MWVFALGYVATAVACAAAGYAIGVRRVPVSPAALPSMRARYAALVALAETIEACAQVTARKGRDLEAVEVSGRAQVIRAQAEALASRIDPLAVTADAPSNVVSIRGPK